MKIEIEIPDERIKAAVQSAAEDVIMPAGRVTVSNENIRLTNEIRRRVRETVEGLAIAEIITEISRKVLRTEVRDVVTATIRAEARKQVKQLRAQGELFGD